LLPAANVFASTLYSSQGAPPASHVCVTEVLADVELDAGSKIEVHAREMDAEANTINRATARIADLLFISLPPL
jgi:hypothetical protein